MQIKGMNDHRLYVHNFSCEKKKNEARKKQQQQQFRLGWDSNP